MIYTTLLEPYYFPKLIPIEVTVLRGSRRLRLSSSLRKKYADFVPKIWHIMAKLGYQKYLQKIYVSVDCATTLTSPYYQLPVVIAILQAVGMFRSAKDVYAMGRFLADYTLAFPLTLKEGASVVPSVDLLTTPPEENIRLEQFLNRLHTEPTSFLPPNFDLRELFPGVLFAPGGEIDIGATGINVLKLIPMSTLQERQLYVSLRHKPLTEQKLALLQRLTLKIPLALSHTTCFCEKAPCTCTENEKYQHQYQVDLLESLYH